jgi:hypothetical protein
MARTRLRCLASFVAVIFSVSLPSPAFETPLSDTAVREAYFLGQRRDETMGRILDKYTIYLAAPTYRFCHHVYALRSGHSLLPRQDFWL